MRESIFDAPGIELFTRDQHSDAPHAQSLELEVGGWNYDERWKTPEGRDEMLEVIQELVISLTQAHSFLRELPFT